VLIAAAASGGQLIAAAAAGNLDAVAFAVARSRGPILNTQHGSLATAWPPGDEGRAWLCLQCIASAPFTSSWVQTNHWGHREGPPGPGLLPRSSRGIPRCRRPGSSSGALHRLSVPWVCLWVVLLLAVPRAVPRAPAPLLRLRLLLLLLLRL